MHIYLKNEEQSAKFHPIILSWNDEAFGCFEEHQPNKNNNMMSNDTGSVPDPKTILALTIAKTTRHPTLASNEMTQQLHTTVLNRFLITVLSTN